MLTPELWADDGNAGALTIVNRERFLEAYEQAYSELRNDGDEWARVQTEQRAFDGTLMDGLERADE